MFTNEALEKAKRVLALSGAAARGVNFLTYARDVAAAGRDIPVSQRPEWFNEWAIAWRRIYDDFDTVVHADPMLLYEPKNKMAWGFHQSRAFVRYACTANRCSKTTSGIAEDYFCVTGFHPYRSDLPQTQASALILAGLPFTDYAPRVFEKKLLRGEDGNILSPVFPEGGKWFYHYDPRKYILTLACRECAEKGQAGSCPGHHTKYTLALVSSEKGVSVVEAFTVRSFHIDEHVDEAFYHAGKMRVADQPGGFMLVTGTPNQGTEAWETKKLRAVAEGSKELNRYSSLEPDRPLVSLHEASMYEGGVVSESTIEAMKADMDEFEIQSRIYGKPAPLANNPVFDRKVLAEMQKGCVEPKRYHMHSTKALLEVDSGSDVQLKADARGPLRIWEPPKPGAQYIIGVDTAAGLSEKTHDASCASVLKLGVKGAQLTLDMVAQFHAWVNPLSYGEEIVKLGMLYNIATVIIELTGGLGRAVALKMSRDLAYPAIFRDTSKPEFAEFGQDARFGVDTNTTTKPFMVSILQQFVQAGLINIRCSETIREMVAFTQETKTSTGQMLMVSRYKGAGGAHDDRVMSLVIAAATAVSAPMFDVTQEMANRPEANQKFQSRTEYDEEWNKIHRELNDSAVLDPFSV